MRGESRRGWGTAALASAEGSLARCENMPGLVPVIIPAYNAAGLIGEFELEDRVTLAGFAARSGVTVPAFDVFCWLGLVGESLPLSLVEAASFRIPAIAAAVEGIPEDLINERLDWLIPPGDDDALLDAMRQAARKARCAARVDGYRRLPVDRGSFSGGRQVKRIARHGLSLT